jgi:5-hydroxyisourate hydrolase-like protein (transthyretin family)
VTARKNLASIYLFFTISLILVNVTPLASAQNSENTGKIHGQVTLINKPLANQTVLLSKMQNNTLLLIANVTTDKNGNYTFENLALEETYLVSLIFQGVPYNKEVNFENQTSVQIDFTVYETTTSDADMKIRMIHLIIKLEEKHLRILEDAVYINAGLKVFNNSRLKAWLPSDIYGFKTSVMDCCVQQFEDNVLFDPMDPIKPNDKYSMWMEYNIEISSSEQQFEKKLAYDTEQFYLIIENKSGVTAEITSGLVNKSRIIEEGNVEYTVFNGTDLKANSTIVVRFTGLLAPKNYGLLFLWLIIPLILGIGFFTYPIVRKSTSEKKTLLHDLEAKKLMLFEAIAKLDSEYAAGKISKEKYEKLKSKHKKKVIEIIQQMEKGKGTQLTPPVSPSPILTELYAEEQALISTLHKLDLDYKKELVSAESYRKMKSKFEHRRAEVVKKIKKLEKTENKEDIPAG